MAVSTLKRLARGLKAWPVVALLAMLLIALNLMSSAVQNTVELGRWFVPLIIISITGLLLLFVLIGVQLSRLVTAYRNQAVGSRLAGRLVALFVLLSLAPVSVVYYYSLQFLLRGIDSWFDVQIDGAMSDALELSQASLGLHMRELQKQAQQMLSDIADEADTVVEVRLAELRNEQGATEMALMDLGGRVLASSHADPGEFVPDRPEEAIMFQLRQGSDYVGLAPLADEGMHVRVVVREPRGSPLLLQVLYRMPERIQVLTEVVQAAYSRYKELAYQRPFLKYNFALILSLVLLFSFLTAVWTAFVSAKSVVGPIRWLAEGTRAVADGDYDKQLPLPGSDDEVGFLVRSFNDMTRRIAQARDAASQSQQEVEAQRAYLEIVLARLSSGVMTLDRSARLRTANQAAVHILKLRDLDALVERPLPGLLEQHPHLHSFVEAVTKSLDHKGEEWREEITLFGPDGRQVLLCRSTPLSVPAGGQSGHVVVFDDITALIKAQRDAAWSEAARRLAHEIKNPLTPIQLSAERIRHKFLANLGPEEAAVLIRSTHTIVQQVEALKAMVNAFSDYARPTQIRPEAVNIDKLLTEVLELYRTDSGTGSLEIELDSRSATVEVDPLRFRQITHNLIKNALEAVAGREDAKIIVASRLVDEGGSHSVELRFMDNGPGIDEDMLTHIFEPYVTTKTKGTGLGLAIVKKIIEEHGGMIWAENRPEGGACFALRLPLLVHPVSIRDDAGSGGESETRRHKA